MLKLFTRKNLLMGSVGGLLFMGGYWTGHWWTSNHSATQNITKPLRAGVHGQLTNPLIGILIPENVGRIKYDSLYKALARQTDRAIQRGEIEKASIYFRTLDNGYWVGVNENEKFSPASMLKVMILMAYFKLAETEPKILSRQILYDGSFDKNNDLYYPPSSKLEKGRRYTILDLLERMVRYSDNNANYLLLKENIIGVEQLRSLFSYLNMPIPDFYNDIDTFSTQEYSRFYRVLYGSTYLNQTLSEKALNILSQADFNHGLANNIPSNTTVAHKFGERSVPLPDGSIIKELHDCGIIYYPNNPYFLCIMTKGNNFDVMNKFIQEITSLTYKMAGTLDH